MSPPSALSGRGTERILVNFLFYLYGACVGFPAGLVVGLWLKKK